LMGVLGPVVQISTLPMNDMRKDSPFGSAVASELVGNNDWPKCKTRSSL
jgi:hypothetical protein